VSQLQRPESTGHFRAAPPSRMALPIRSKWKLSTLDGPTATESKKQSANPETAISSPELKIPRSTIRSWIPRGTPDVISCDFAGGERAELVVEIERHRRRAGLPTSRPYTLDYR